MVTPPNVEALMSAGLGAWLDGQHVAREEAKAKAAFRIKTGFAVAGVFLVLGILMGWKFNFILWAVGGSIAVGFALAEAAKRPVINAIKGEMNQRIAAAMGFSFAMEGEPGPAFDLAYAHDVLPSYDKVESEDYWTGTLDTLPFSLFELHLREWRGAGKSRRLETVFRGPLLQVQFARQFSGITLIERDGSRLSSMFSVFSDGKITLDGSNMERAKMVDPAFEDAFDVWTTDQVEARYLVHPAYCERLLAIEQSFNGEKLRALFHGGSLIVAIETSPLFESGSLDADRDRDLMLQTIDQFTELAGLAKALNERPRG